MQNNKHFPQPAFNSQATHRKELENRKNELGSYQKLADDLGINVRYVWEYIKHGIMPVNRDVQKALGLHVNVDTSVPLSQRRAQLPECYKRAADYLASKERNRNVYTRK